MSSCETLILGNQIMLNFFEGNKVSGRGGIQWGKRPRETIGSDRAKIDHRVSWPVHICKCSGVARLGYSRDLCTLGCQASGLWWTIPGGQNGLQQYHARSNAGDASIGPMIRTVQILRRLAIVSIKSWWRRLRPLKPTQYWFWNHQQYASEKSLTGLISASFTSKVE